MPVVLMYPALGPPPLFPLASITYPLDLVAGATGAWSLRKLAVAYAGNCLKVRRSSDNATQDIGFSGSYCDFAALSAFVGSGDGYIDTWYDQTTNSRNMVQATTARQPQIVASGAYVTTIGGYPGLDYAATYLETSASQSTLLSSTAGTVFALWNADTATSTTDGNTVWCNRGGWNGTFIKTVSGTPRLRIMGYDGTEDFVDATPYAVNTSYVTAWRHDSGTLYSYVGGSTAVGSVAHGTETDLSGHMCLGREAQTTNSSSIFDGRLTEVICYNTALSSGDLGTIGAAMAVPFGLTWS